MELTDADRRAHAWAQSFADDLRAEIGDVAAVTSKPYPMTAYWDVLVSPVNIAAAGFGVIAAGGEMIVHFGGARTELGVSTEDRALLRGIADAVIAGRITEQVNPVRAHAEVTLADGTVHSSTVVGWTGGFLSALRHRRSRSEPIARAPYRGWSDPPIGGDR